MASRLFQPYNLQSKDPELQIVMIGRVGVGKSATGNTILRRKAFQSLISSSSVTKKCQIEKGEWDGQNLAVVDTPGLFASTTSDSSDVKTQDEVMEKVKSCVKLASPGPVVFLVVIQIGRFTQDEQQTVQVIKRTFGKEAAHSTMALFTRGDDLKTEGRSIEEFIGQNPALRDFIREGPGGYHVFDNRDTDDPSQVSELLQKINNMLRRNGASGFTSDAERVVRREEEQEAGADRGNAKAFNKVAVAFTVGMIALVIVLVKKNPKSDVAVGAVRGVVGAVASAAKYVASTLRLMH